MGAGSGGGGAGGRGGSGEQGGRGLWVVDSCVKEYMNINYIQYNNNIVI